MKDHLDNSRLPPLIVRHADLERVGDSAYRRRCPACGRGILPMRRDENDDLLSTDVSESHG